MCLLSIWLAVSLPANAQTFDKFTVDNPIVYWTASTNQLNAELWVYKVYPQEFSINGVNHLLKAGGFTNRIINQKQGISVVNSSNTCKIVVNPQLGIIQYWNEYAAANRWDKSTHIHEAVTGLPRQKEIDGLGLKLLKRFGIEKSDLAKKENGHLITFGENRTRSYFDRKTQKYVDDEVFMRGIIFNRRIDGVNFAGIGIGSGCQIDFGNNGNIARFNLVWRNLQPYQKYKTKTPDEIKQSILNGESSLTHKNFVNGLDVKTITITEYSPLYMGADDNETPQFCSPFGKIEAVANTGTTNVEIELYCPILSTNIIVSPLRHAR